MAHYLDTSALLKLVLHERQTPALATWTTRQAAQVLASSELTRTELMRAVRRADPSGAERARAVLESLELLALDHSILDEAGRIGPVALRSLDAIHLASALTLGDELDSIVTYDTRLADAARALGIPAVAPS